MATNRDLLKEAIADAKAVKETAIANAKAALQEAFAPQVQALFTAKLQEIEKEDDLEEMYGKSEDEKVNETYSDMDPKGPTAHGNVEESEDDMTNEIDLEELLRELELEEGEAEGLYEAEEEVGMSTEEFAEHRHQIGSEPFNFKGTTVVGYAPDPFRNFGVKGDKRFVIDSMIAPLGPSWNDFVECINGGSIFAIITARGHNPETLKEAVLNLIVANHNGINRQTLVDNLIKYRKFTEEEQIEEAYDLEFSDKDIINEYLDMCRFHPVSFGAGSAANPEEGKIKAMREFISYCREMAKEIGKSAFFKNDVTNQEPIIGFSDDDLRNVEKMKEFSLPTAQCDEAITHLNNIEIACDLDSEESLSWKPFTKPAYIYTTRYVAPNYKRDRTT